VLTGAGTRKARSIEAAGFFSLMVQRLEPTRRYVAVDGAVSRIQPATDDQLVELTRRHLSGDAADRHLDFLRNPRQTSRDLNAPKTLAISDDESF
jgi:hypothetical protein